MARLKPKKILISGLVLVSFIFYGVSVRQDNKPSAAPKPKPSSDTSSSAKAPTAPTTKASKYKDGAYIGPVTDALYGDLQVQAIIQGGRLVGVEFLQYPNDRPESTSINEQAIPFLQQEAIKAQDARVDSISGATDTSKAFVESLSVALSKAM
jgi:uncharacterized protein with FMN-binding domain